MQDYDVTSIKHYETREAMRNRIQVYLGSDDTEGIYQALKEIINNSTDEALAGYGNEIHIVVDEKKNEITVRDYGRGVPFGIVDDRNILVSIYTESHTGGKFDKNVYKTSSGLNGLGGTAVCMTSSSFIVKSIRNNTMATATFKEGNLIDYSETKCEDKSGTIVNFIPDKKVFVNMTEGFSFKRICDEIKTIAYLNKGLRFIVEEMGGKKSEFYSENGIADFIKDNVKNPLMSYPITCSAKDDDDEVEVVFMWTTGVEESYVFVNGLFCPSGGSPIRGAKTTFASSIKKLSGKKIEPELIRKGLVYAVNCKVANPSFKDQTKSKINNSNLSTLTSQALKQGMEEFANIPEYSSIIEMMIRFQKAEHEADKAREAVLNHTKKMSEIRGQKVAFLNKLSDAENLGQDSILCVCEGDSAGGSMAIGRDTKKYGVLKLKGKMINGLKENDEEKYLRNDEIELLLYALGIDINNYNPNKLRYGKIAICADADDDGCHIGLLIIANLLRICPQFLEENRLYWLRCPLFVEYDKDGHPVSWYYTDKEYNAVKDSLKGFTDRIKGLGQLEKEDLEKTMFSTTGGQRMDKLVYSEEGVRQLCLLMGEDIQPRKDFVMERIDFSSYINK